jgi:hypothetical protein
MMPRERAGRACEPLVFHASSRGFVLPEMRASAARAGEASRPARPDHATRARHCRIIRHDIHRRDLLTISYIYPAHAGDCGPPIASFQQKNSHCVTYVFQQLIRGGAARLRPALRAKIAHPMRKTGM